MQLCGASMELRVGRKYRLGRKLGEGAFGAIYLGVNVLSGESVAIKLEPLDSKHQQLVYEAKIYKLLEGGGAYHGDCAWCCSAAFGQGREGARLLNATFSHVLRSPAHSRSWCPAHSLVWCGRRL